MKPESDQDQLREVFIGRQPILDGNQSLIGYELQFHDTAIPPTDHAVATADMVCKAFIELGLADAFGQALTFIRVDGNFVDEDFVELLPPKTVVLEVDAATLRGEGKLERCRHCCASLDTASACKTSQKSAKAFGRWSNWWNGSRSTYRPSRRLSSRP
jgi:hypothetical protein